MEPVNFQPSRALSPNPSVEEIEQDILNFLEDPNIWPARADKVGSRQDRFATFATFERRFGRPRFKGLDMTVANKPNVILWQGLSENLATAVGNLISQRKMHWHYLTSWDLGYYSRLIPLPIAEDVCGYIYPAADSDLEPQPIEYDRPHWLPVVFVPGPFCDDIDCPNSPIPFEERWDKWFTIPENKKRMDEFYERFRRKH
jgi:hypothetical protein